MKWNYGRIYIFLWLLQFGFDVTARNQDGLVIRSERNTCCPKVSLQNCNVNGNSEGNWQWYSRSDIKIVSKVQKGCTDSALKYNWKLNRISGSIRHSPLGVKKAVLYVLKYSLTPGKYSVSLEVTESHNYPCVINSNACFLDIIAEVPNVIISGGTLRTVPANSVIYFQAIVKDFNSERTDINVFKYNWSCKSSSNDLCKLETYSSTDRAYIGNEHVIDGTKFTVTVNVTNSYGKMITAMQDIEVQSNSLPMTILCLKNCITNTNVLDVVVFHGTCGNNCKRTNEFKWSLINEDTKETIDNIFINDNVYLSTKFDALKSDTTYLTTLSVDESSFAKFRIKTDYVELADCTVEPSARDELLTLFKIDCRDFTSGTLYQLFQVYEIYGDEHLVLLATETVPYFEVYLGSGAIFLHIYKHTGYFDNIEIPIKPIADKTFDVLPYLKQNLPQLVHDNLQEKSVQIINCLVDVIESPDDIKQIGFYVTDVLQSFPIYSLHDAYQIGSLLGKFVLPEDDADPVYQAYLASSCKIISQKFMQHIIKQTRRKELFVFAEKFQKCIDVCVTYVLNDKNVDETVDEGSGQELLSNDYSNYDDLESDFRKREFIESTQYAMDIVRIAAAAIAHTLNSDQIRFSQDEEFYYVSCVIFPEINKQKFKHESATIYLDYDPKYKHRFVAGTQIVYKKNIFWWHEKSKEMATAITDISIYLSNSGQLITKAGDNVTVVFKVENADINEIDGSVNVPQNKQEWVPEIIDYQLTVHRLNTLHGTNLLLIFDNLVDAEVVVLINRRPRLDDFKKSKNIDKSVTLIFPNKIGDGWFYVAILPKMKEGSTGAGNMAFNYKFKYALQSCNFWNRNSKEWSTAGCQTVKPTNIDVVYCKCNHMSAFMSTVGPTKNKEDDILLILFALELQYTYTIPIIVYVFFLLYIIFICIGTSRMKTFNLKDKLLFLADNSKDECYGYLLIVKTGDKKNCGTTSNISIKLVGNKATSQVHVLNYPDPEKRILQRNSEDWFILTTKQHLGNLLEIHMWFDCVGIRPSWCCNYVRAYDLQLQEEWIFHIDSELTLLEENKSYFSVTSDVPLEPGVWKHKLKSKYRNYKSEGHSWNIFNKTDDYVSYVRRITIMLSMIYTIFTISLFIISSPCLMLKDGLDYGDYSIQPIMFISAIVSSLISFGTHLGIQILFQRYDEENQKEIRKKKILYIWIGLISLLILNLTLLMVFGLWVPYYAVLIWITSVFISLLLIVVVYESVFMLVRAFFFKQVKQKIIGNTDLLIKEAENQRWYLHNKFGDTILRPYLIFKYEPLTLKKIKYKSLIEKSRLELSFLVKELYTFFFYVILLLAVIICSGSSELRRSNEGIKQLILNSNGRSDPFNITTYKDIYHYINRTLIEHCFPNEWYDGANITDNGLLIDVVNNLIGVIQIRQKRVIKNTCGQSKSIYSLNMSCVPEYDEYYAGSFPDNPYAGRFKYIWTKRNLDTFSAISITYGNINWYSGSGFVALLGRNRYNSMYVLKYLKDNNWIDEQTRLVLIKFWTYNVNDNVFNTVNIIIEKSATGLFINSHSIYTIKLFSNTAFERISYMIISILFMYITFKLILILILKFFRSGLRTIFNFWNVFDLIIITMTIFLILLYLYRLQLIKTLMNALELSPNNAFISFSAITYLSRTINIMSAILMCFAIIRLWKYLRFVVVFRVMENTILNAKYILLVTFIYHIVMLLAFVLTGYILFGAKHNDFKNLTSTFTTLILLSLDLFFNVDFIFTDSLSCLFYSFFTIFSLAIYTFYISIIVFHYSKCRQELSNIREVYTINDYLKEEFTYYKELLRVRLRGRLRGGQQDHDEAVYPKSFPIRYANCSILSSYDLEFMSLIARGVMRNLRKNDNALSQKEIMLMLDVIRHLINTSKRKRREIFYEGADVDGIKIVPDDRILKMEQIVRKMFQPKQKDEPRYLIIEANSNLDRLQYYENVLELIREVFGNITFNN